MRHNNHQNNNGNGNPKGPALRQGLTVLELKAMTASRIANQNSHSNPNANSNQSGNLDIDINSYNKTNLHVTQPRQQKHHQQQQQQLQPRFQEDTNQINLRSQYHKQQQQSYQQMNPYQQQNIRLNLQSSQHQRSNNNSVLGDSRPSGVRIIDNHFIPSQPINYINNQIKNSQQQTSGPVALTVQELKELTRRRLARESEPFVASLNNVEIDTNFDCNISDKYPMQFSRSGSTTPDDNSLIDEGDIPFIGNQVHNQGNIFGNISQGTYKNAPNSNISTFIPALNRNIYPLEQNMNKKNIDNQEIETNNNLSVNFKNINSIPISSASLSVNTVQAPQSLRKQAINFASNKVFSDELPSLLTGINIDSGPVRIRSNSITSNDSPPVSPRSLRHKSSLKVFIPCPAPVRRRSISDSIANVALEMAESVLDACNTPNSPSYASFRKASIERRGSDVSDGGTIETLSKSLKKSGVSSDSSDFGSVYNSSWNYRLSVNSPQLDQWLINPNQKQEEIQFNDNEFYTLDENDHNK